MKRLIKLPLMLLFALLQCMVPFAHAHVDGHNEDSHVHIALANGLNVHPVSTIQASADTTHSGVVVMQPVYRYMAIAIAQPVAETVQILPAIAAQSVLSLPVFEQKILPLPPYHHPCSQAPPV